MKVAWSDLHIPVHCAFISVCVHNRQWIGGLFAVCTCIRVSWMRGQLLWKHQSCSWLTLVRTHDRPYTWYALLKDFFLLLLLTVGKTEELLANVEYRCVFISIFPVSISSLRRFSTADHYYLIMVLSCIILVSSWYHVLYNRLVKEVSLLFQPTVWRNCQPPLLTCDFMRHEDMHILLRWNENRCIYSKKCLNSSCLHYKGLT